MPKSKEEWKNKEDGTYTCTGCGAELFSSDTKFESGATGKRFCINSCALDFKKKKK